MNRFKVLFADMITWMDSPFFGSYLETDHTPSASLLQAFGLKPWEIHLSEWKRHFSKMTNEQIQELVDRYEGKDDEET